MIRSLLQFSLKCVLFQERQSTVMHVWSDGIVADSFVTVPQPARHSASYGHTALGFL
jgi:hypothetical protein